MEKIEEIVEKIKKVMELATRGSTEAERDTAMLKAQKLLDRYNLSMSQVTGSKSDKKYVEGNKINTVDKSSLIERSVSDIIVSYYNVKIIIFKDPQRYRSLKIFGQKHNVAIATYMHPWLTMEFDYRWNLYKSENKLKGTKHKNSFIFGLFQGLKMKLQKQREELVKEYSGSTDVAVLDESEQIMNWLMESMDIKKGKSHTVDIHSDEALEAGVVEGEKINLSEQVEC